MRVGVVTRVHPGVGGSAAGWGCELSVLRKQRRLGEVWPDQAHIRHRTACIGIIMPVLPGASTEVGMNTLSVMG